MTGDVSRAASGEGMAEPIQARRQQGDWHVNGLTAKDWQSPPQFLGKGRRVSEPTDRVNLLDSFEQRYHFAQELSLKLDGRPEIRVSVSKSAPSTEGLVRQPLTQ